MNHMNTWTYLLVNICAGYLKFIFLGKEFWMHVFCFTRYCQNVLQSGCSNLHSHHQHEVLVALTPDSMGNLPGVKEPPLGIRDGFPQPQHKEDIKNINAQEK